jgi:hypothetical protein
MWNLTPEFRRRAKVKVILRIVVMAVALASLAAAQMGMMGGGGGMMGGGGIIGGGNDGTMGPGGVYGMSYGMMGGKSFGMGSGMSDTFGPAIGPDGTVYVLRWTTGTSQGQTQLVAIDPQSGKSKWTVTVDGVLVSQPVVGSDGKIFLTTSAGSLSDMSGSMMGSGMSGSTPAGAASATLLIVNSTGGKQTVTLPGDFASAPKIGTNGSGGYQVYVMVSDIGSIMGNQNQSASGRSYLSAFSPDGTERFKLQLN